jgi:hypothetical protein
VTPTIISEANADARRPAALIMQASGGQRGEAHKTRPGVIQVVCPDSTAMTSHGMYDTSDVKKDASVVVIVEFSATSS